MKNLFIRLLERDIITKKPKWYWRQSIDALECALKFAINPRYLSTRNDLKYFASLNSSLRFGFLLLSPMLMFDIVSRMMSFNALTRKNLGVIYESNTTSMPKAPF